MSSEGKSRNRHAINQRLYDRKALTMNLDTSKFGSFAEIGAGRRSRAGSLRLAVRRAPSPEASPPKTRNSATVSTAPVHAMSHALLLLCRYCLFVSRICQALQEFEFVIALVVVGRNPNSLIRTKQTTN